MDEALQQAEVKNKTMASVIFQKIKDYRFLHVSSVSAITNAVADNIPGIGDFLEARFRNESYIVQNTSFRKFKNSIKRSLEIRNDDKVIKKYVGLCELDLWTPESKVKEELF